MPNKHPRMARLSSGGAGRAFTLIELLLVIFIMLLLTVMIVPILSQLTKSSKVQQACSILSTALYRARNEAIRNRTPVALFVGDDLSRLKIAPTPGILPRQGCVELWTVLTDTGDHDGISAYGAPYNWGGQGWYPYKNPDRNLTQDPIVLPDGIRVLAGFFGHNSTTTCYFSHFISNGWPGGYFQWSPDGEIKRHQIVYSRGGGINGQLVFDTLLVFNEVTGENALLWCGDYYSSSKPRILTNKLIGVYGPSQTYYPINKNSDLPAAVDN